MIGPDNIDLEAELEALTPEELGIVYQQLVPMTESPVDILEFVTNTDYLGNFLEGGLYPIWKSPIEEIFPNPYFSPFSEVCFTGCIGCFTGDTKISLLDGRELSFLELEKEYKDKDFWVYSYNLEKNKIVPGKAHSPRKTGSKVDILELEFDNGKKIKCTYNHKFLLRNGEYKEAKDLKENDSLMPLYKRLDSDGYYEIYDPITQTSKNVHKIVYDEIYGEQNRKRKLEKDCGNVIHHIDYNKFNNTPENLNLMSFRSHTKFHNEHTKYSIHKRWLDPIKREEAIKKARKNMVRLNNTKEHQVKCINGRKKIGFQNEAERLRQYNKTDHPNLRKEITFDLILKTAQHTQSGREVTKLLNCSWSLIQSRIKEYGFFTWKDFCKNYNLEKNLHNTYSKCAWGNNNHKIKSIKKIGQEDVYDITVDKYHNFALSSGIFVHNSGKSTIAIIIFLYDMYRLLILKNPHKTLDLPSSTKLCFHIFNATLTLADNVIWDQTKQAITRSPFFSEMYRKHAGETSFPHRIEINTGSRFTHGLGSAVFACILDEVNFQIIGNQSYKSYNALLRRKESRFMGEGGWTPGHTLLVSSSDTDSSFMEEHIKNSKNNKLSKVYSFSMWESKWHKGIYSGVFFPVFKGTRHEDAKVLDEKGAEAYQDEMIMQVPVEHMSAFELDVVAALRDIGGISVGSDIRRKLFSSVNVLRDTIVFNNYFNKEVIELDFFDDNDQLVDYFQIDRYVNKRKYPKNTRFIHIDTGLTGDLLGMACCYFAGWKTIKRHIFTTDYDGPKEFREPIIHVEWAIGIRAKANSEIPLFKIREFLLLHVNGNGIPLKLISTDGFQSRDMRQMIRKAGVADAEVSTDRTPDAYITLRNATFEMRCLMPIHELLKTELLNLVIDSKKKKVDHPENGSKDIADAVAGCVHSAVTYQLENRDMIAEVADELSSHQQKLVGNLYDNIKKQQWEKL